MDIVKRVLNWGIILLAVAIFGLLFLLRMEVGGVDNGFFKLVIWLLMVRSGVFILLLLMAGRLVIFIFDQYKEL